MFTSYRVAELVRQSISTPYVTASDTEVASALGVSRATVSAWKHGKAKMSASVMAKALALVKSDPWEIGDAYFRHMQELADSDNERGIWRSLQAMCHGIAKATKNKVAGLALAMVAAGAIFAPAGNQASAASLASFNSTENIHYAPYGNRAAARCALGSLTAQRSNRL